MHASSSSAETMDRLGRDGVPFLFVIDFEMQSPLVLPLAEVDPGEILYDIEGFTNFPAGTISPHDRDAEPVLRERRPVSYARYREAFDVVQAHLRAGNTYLVNLTFPTSIVLTRPLGELFPLCRARYRLYVKNRFLVFSPERFVRVRDQVISTYPMKGTMDASIEGAEEKLLADEKEIAEHVTVVDLLRNDLNIVSRGVRVPRFRYVEHIVAGGKGLLQVSSHIEGTLEEAWRERIGRIITAMLPAGSVSGAPKKKTVQIIREAEGSPRGYYTGVFGYFDGTNLDSGVMIRFIEQLPDGGFLYRSGGGITIESDPESEYRELIDKVYVPIA